MWRIAVPLAGIRGLALRAVLLALASGIPGAVAHAQGLTYAPQPPTPGALYGDGQRGRYLLGGAWLYRADLADGGLAQGWWGDVAATDGWTPVSVPNSYNAGDLTPASMNGYVGWYRRDFTLPPGAFARYVKASDRHWIIRFESVNYRAAVWLNGRRIGTHAGAYLPFELDLSGLRAGVNRLIVRVDDRRRPSDLPAGPGGGWWNFGGIQREVYLRAAQRVDLVRVQVRPILRCPSCAATISEQASLRNLTDTSQTVLLRGRYGGLPLDFGTFTISPHATRTVHALSLIRKPRLWSIEDPVLYRASLTLSDGQQRELGSYTARSGIRMITVSHGRLLLNGRALTLRGVNIHEQDLIQGAALDPAHLSRLVGWSRSVGATMIRAHYPLSPQIEEQADRSGILLWSEIPVYGVPGPYLGQSSWQAGARTMLQEDILANQNHPSVMLWSVGNELPTPATSGEAAYISSAVALAHTLDPTRPVGMAVSSWPGVPCTQAYAPLDVIGFNDYFGWFDAGGGGTADRDSLSPFLDFLRQCYPTKALLATEFGFDGNRHGPVEERGTYEFQADAIAYHLGVFATKRWLSGAIYFALQDFAAKPGWAGGNPVGTPPFVQKGMFDSQGNVKPAFPALSQIYRATTQIAPSPGRR